MYRYRIVEHSKYGKNAFGLNYFPTLEMAYSFLEIYVRLLKKAKHSFMYLDGTKYFYMVDREIIKNNI